MQDRAAAEARNSYRCAPAPPWVLELSKDARGSQGRRRARRDSKHERRVCSLIKLETFTRRLQWDVNSSAVLASAAGGVEQEAERGGRGRAGPQ